jgi:hypothetical protein
MIFDFFSSFALELIAVVSAAAFLVWIEGQNCGCKRSSKALGYVVLILAAGTLACTFYHGYKYSRAGAFKAQPKLPKVQMQMDGMNFGPTMNPSAANPMMQQMQQHMRQMMPQQNAQQGGPQQGMMPGMMQNNGGPGMMMPPQQQGGPGMPPQPPKNGFDQDLPPLEGN